MNTTTIFSKTEKGSAALREEGALGQTERLILVFIDGKKTVEDVISALGSRIDFKAALDSLKLLEQQGYISEAVSGAGDDVIVLNGNMQQQLEEQMIEFLGPMAKIICEDVFKNTSDFASALSQLMDNLPKDKVAEFNERITKIIAKS